MWSNATWSWWPRLCHLLDGSTMEEVRKFVKARHWKWSFGNEAGNILNWQTQCRWPKQTEGTTVALQIMFYKVERLKQYTSYPHSTFMCHREAASTFEQWLENVRTKVIKAAGPLRASNGAATQDDQEMASVLNEASSCFRCHVLPKSTSGNTIPTWLCETWNTNNPLPTLRGTTEIISPKSCFLRSVGNVRAKPLKLRQMFDFFGGNLHIF